MRMTKADIKQKRAELVEVLLKIDWMGLVTALVKAALPFLAGAVGGIAAGCTVGGIGPNFFT